jgi:hypothetical protein
VHGLAQVEMEILRRAAPMAVESHCRHRPGHERDADAGPEPVGGRHDRILSGEGDGTYSPGPTGTDVCQQIVEGRQRIE